MASKNIFSEGYIHFPLAETPVSISWLEGRTAAGSAGEVAARGIEDTTRFSSRMELGVWVFCFEGVVSGSEEGCCREKGEGIRGSQEDHDEACAWGGCCAAVGVAVIDG